MKYRIKNDNYKNFAVFKDNVLKPRSYFIPFKDTEKMLSDGGAFQYDAVEIKNLDDREIFTRLILTKSGLNADSEEGKAAVENVLPLFMKLAGEV